ncbi:hypothetical protein MFLO_08102 [Listeria floridensis FSL S10-1187]|uniref:Uncharacterized protein n=1 Tax=Listeria floridensis FSL S10-1187 TaxID=1265817 RepID=A0ABN0RF45_9LIST|nr:hypothetical protein MFLO_08102 [Listeria floridensis FSL S10-1187]
MFSTNSLLQKRMLLSKPRKQKQKQKTETTTSKENSDTWKKKYEKLLAEQELEKNKAAEEKRLAEQKKNEVKKYKLVIAKGDPSSKASQDLEKNGIVKSATEFEKFLKQNNYEKYIRDGSYEVTNKMTYDQIAKKLAHK